MRRSIALSVAALLIAATAPVATVRAADVDVAVTMSSDPSTVVRGGGPYDATGGFYPHDATGTFEFQWSQDGTTWQHLADGTEINHLVGVVHGYYSIPVDAQLGTRWLRVVYTADPGFVSKTSDPASQQVSKVSAWVDSFTVSNTSGGAVLPGGQVRYSARTNQSLTLEFQRETATGWETLVTSPTSPDGNGYRVASVVGPALGEGSHHLRAYAPETGLLLPGEATMTKQVDRVASEVSWQSAENFEAGKPTAIVVLVAGSTLIPPTGTVEIIDVGTGQTLDSTSVGGTAHLQFDAPGSYNLETRYLGDVNHLPSSSFGGVTVFADVVQAESVGVQYTTFYPYSDGYRDTNMISGRRLETSTAVIRIYSPTGAKIRTLGIPSGSGAYTYKWSGRNSSGTILAAGKYKITQTITDTLGHAQTWTFYATLSRKRLVTKTAYITRKGSSISAKGDSGTGYVSISTTGGYAKLHGVYPTGWVGVGYQFALPSATVYKSITFEVYNKGVMRPNGPEIRMQNFVWCPYNSAADWNFGCFDRQKYAGSLSGATVWTKTTGSVTTNRYGRTVRGAVGVPLGTLYVYTARLRVVYKVLV